jgi:hypothetical protein
MRTVELPVDSSIIIENAHEFDLLKSYPFTVGWKWAGTSGVRHYFRRTSPPRLQILLVNERANVQEILFSTLVDDN